MSTKEYITSIRPENSAHVDVLYGASIIAHSIPTADAAQVIADHKARLAARLAKVAAYEAAGMSIIRDASDMPRAARFRHMNRLAVVDADGQIIAHYASLDEVPELETPAVEETAEAEVDAVATAEATEVAAPIRGTITDAQAERIIDLIRAGAHEEGGFYAGPTTETGVLAMSREDAALYIDSLTDRY